MNQEKIIQKKRKKLDQITEDMVKIIRKRNKVVLEIGKVKKQIGLPITNLKRDKEVIEKAKLISVRKGVDPDIVEKIMRILMKYAKKIQKKQR